MKKEIVISYQNKNARVALREDEKLMEFYMEEGENSQKVGNIYKGKVKDILPGMQAAFVDIGFSKNAFLYVGDIVINGQEAKNEKIEELLTPDQNIMVQVIKEQMGSKGARVTCNLTVPGRYLVLMPFNNYVGISRRIEDADERERLREIAADMKHEDFGVIIRTVANGISKDKLKKDLDFLVGLWNNIEDNYNNYSSPSMVYSDLDLVGRALRDFFDNEVDCLYIDDHEQYEKILNILRIKSPKLIDKVRYYEIKNPIFYQFGIDRELQKAFERKIWLKSGGYLVIDQLEALTVIDVNTGKFVGSKNLADTVLKTNMEAVAETCRQIRLRDLSGIIIIDFIDMPKDEHKELVLNFLHEEMKKDHTKGQILGITQLGLVEITRKKIRKGIYNSMQQKCPTCNGSGRFMNRFTEHMFLEDRIKNFVFLNPSRGYKIKTDCSKLRFLSDKKEQLEKELGCHIILEKVNKENDFEITSFD
ncbi:Rne/Rng family ribonuclease [Proteinivorax hydrogeniformans]|uniref:Rne/Rng family ribonuclease n=1 Tax=Proteinivorax hydrogeniformans TaxID=1826727 RepID=A0AAU8HWG9_9FIRM